MSLRHAAPGIAFKAAHRGFCVLVLGFLILPILVVIPLSFNAQPYFSFTANMLSLRPEGFSLRWYLDILENGMADPAQQKWTAAYLQDAWRNGQWLQAARNSFAIGICATILATTLGTAAALGLSRAELPYRKAIMAILLSPMIVPIVITSTALYFSSFPASGSRTPISASSRLIVDRSVKDEPEHW